MILPINPICKKQWVRRDVPKNERIVAKKGVN